MNGRLTGKTAVVTAAAQGIGEATARAFAAEGAQVWATDVNTEKLSALDTVEGITTHRCDVTDESSITALLADTGSQWVVLERLKRSHIWPSTSPQTNRPTPPDKSTSSMEL